MYAIRSYYEELDTVFDGVKKDLGVSISVRPIETLKL